MKVLNLSHKGKTRTISLAGYSILDLQRTEKQVANYQVFRRTRAEIVSLCNDLLKRVNAIEESLTTQTPRSQRRERS